MRKTLKHNHVHNAIKGVVPYKSIRTRRKQHQISFTAPSARIPSQLQLLELTKMFPLKVVTALLLSVLVLLSATSSVEATYRKPPGLNGSIFGKRGNSECYQSEISANNIDFPFSGRRVRFRWQGAERHVWNCAGGLWRLVPAGQQVARQPIGDHQRNDWFPQHSPASRRRRRLYSCIPIPMNNPHSTLPLNYRK